MATGWSSSKKENTNFARLCRLLVDGGTHVLRDIFDSFHPPSSLHSVLHDQAVRNTLKGLKAKRVLTPHQWDRLYPKTGTVTSGGFDISLLVVLLRNICGLSPPTTGWDKPPEPPDKSRVADLARLKFYRNELYGHITETAVSDSEFEKNWRKISDLLIRLGGPRYKADIERLKVETMDSEEEKYFIETLEEWEETEKDLKRVFKNIGQKIMDKFEEMGGKSRDKESTTKSGGKKYVLDNESTSDECEDKDVCTRVPAEYTKKLKSSIKEQTDLIQPRMRKKKKIRTDDIFTDLTIQRGQKDGRQFDEVKASITTLTNCSEMFICPENDDPKSTATVKTNPKSILLIGKAGIGKTLFCQKLVRDWANDSLFEKEEKSKVPLFEFALLLTFRQLNLLQEEKLCLRDILNCSSLLDGQSIVDEALLQYIIENPEKLLLIIDGYDEYNYRDKIISDFETRYPNDPSKEIPVPAMVAKLLKGKILKDSVVLISSRPVEAEIVEEIPFDATVEITGFSSLQVMKYVENYFQENERLKNEVLEHIKANDFFVSFGEIPVMCFLICFYLEWHFNESRTATTLPVTRANLYHEVIEVFIKKHGDSKYRERKKTREMTETEIQQTLLKLAKLAFNLTKEKKYIFNEEDMKKLKFTEREITNLKESGLLDCCPGVKTSPFDEPTLQYVFIHRTIQEYLCAVRCVEIKEIPDEEETSGVMLIFMAGLLSRNKDKNFMKKLVEKIKLRGYRNIKNKLLVLDVLHEYGDDELSRPIIDNLYHKCFFGSKVIEFSGVTSYVDCVCISYFLNVIKQTTTHLTSHKYLRNTFMIGNSSLSSSGVQVLFQSLAHHHNITTLKLLGCKLDDKCVHLIAKHLLSTKITHLLLWGNNITDAGVKCLCNVLIEPNCRVEELDLRGNRKITDKCKEYHRHLVQKQKPHVKLEFGSSGDKIVCGDRLWCEKEDTKLERTEFVDGYDIPVQVSCLASSLHDESKRVISALQTTRQVIEEFNRDFREIKQRVGKLEQGRTEDCRRMDGTEKRVEALESASVLKR